MVINLGSGEIRLQVRGGGREGGAGKFPRFGTGTLGIRQIPK